MIASNDTILPLLDEQLIIQKHAHETGRVRVSTRVDERDVVISEDLEQETVSIARVTIGREVDAIPAVRQEGDVLIYPVVEEILVIEKRMILKEELHITKCRSLRHVEETVTLKSMQAVVERTAPERLPPADEK